jgi:NAD-dependent DNA ligase
MNRKENPAVVWDYVTVVAYQVVGNEDSKMDQLNQLEREGFDITPYFICDGSALTDEFLSTHLDERRDDTDYAIDGVVLDVNCAKKRAKMNPTRDTLNPEYSIKYKVADESNLAIATVNGVTWNVSKHGFLKPQVNIDPIDLVGVTISNATGFNAKFISENGIGAGAKVKITRSGDVIPFILEVVKSVTPDMPAENCEWNETGVDLVLLDKDNNDEVVINQNIDFFSKIEAPMLKEGNIRKLFEAGFDAPEHIIKADRSTLVSIIGENGNKVFDGLEGRLTDIPAYKLLGAFSTERGMGVRKFKKLQNVVGLNDLVNGQVTMAHILSVEGFEAKSAAKAMIVLGEFGTFLADIEDCYSWEVEVDTSGGSMEGHKVVFTGFRDADLQEAVEKAGGEMQSGVSGKTTMLVTKDPNRTSGKVQKARDKGVAIVGIDELKGMI